MKIDILRPVEEFTKHLDSLSIRQFCKLEDISNDITVVEFDALKWVKLKKYLLWLSYPVIREMSANQVKKPVISKFANGASSIKYQLQLKAWEAGEKLVIFKAYLTQSYLQHINVRTLRQLSEKASGLELQNVEI